MKLVAFLLRSSWRLVTLATIAGVVSGLSSAGLIALINTALPGSEASTIPLAWSFAGLCLVVLATSVLAEVLLTSLGQGSVLQLRMELSRQILAAPFRRLQEVGAPRLLVILTEDVTSIRQAFRAIPFLCIDGAIVVGCLIYLGWLSWPLLLVEACLLAFGIMSFQVLHLKALRSLRLARQQNDVLYGHFRALTEGIKELKLHYHRRQMFLSTALEATAALYRRHFMTGTIIYSIAANWGNLLFFAFMGLLLFVLPGFLEIDAQTLTGSILILLYMMTPLSGVLNDLPTLDQANVALEKVEALGLSLTTNTTEQEGVPPPQPGSAWDNLELVGITHHYHREKEDSSFILGPITVRFSPGEVVFLIGGNGSGKTTLALILTGLYVPESGEIRWNNRPVTDENREHYRQQFSVVFSDCYLFESLLGMGSAALEQQAQEYLVQLQLHHKVRIENGSFSTLDLSQGQRKRLALLTAFLEDRPFYIFDEWAADQDPVFKKIFYTQILPQLKNRGKTVLVITHDAQYFPLADRCITLEDGQVRHEEERETTPHEPTHQVPHTAPT